MDEASQSEMIVPVACGLLAALAFAAVFLRLRNRGDSRDNTLPPSSSDPPGWITTDSAAAPPSQTPSPASDVDAVAAAPPHVEGQQMLAQIMDMQKTGATPDDMLKMIAEGMGGMGGIRGKIMKTVVQSALKNGIPSSGTSSFTFSADISTDSGATHDNLHLDTAAFTKVRELQAQGRSFDDICREINPAYNGWDPQHQQRYRNMMRTVLAFGGIHVGDA